MELKQNQRIKFSIPQGEGESDLEGTGKIVGKATTGQPIIGIAYVIEPDQPISTETYPYSHFCCFEINLEIIKEEHIVE